MVLRTGEGLTGFTSGPRERVQKLIKPISPIQALTKLTAISTKALTEKIARATERQFPKKGRDGNFYGTKEELKEANERWFEQFNWKATRKPEIILKK